VHVTILTKSGVYKRPSNTTLYSIYTATCFDPIGSSSGLLLEHIKKVYNML
jgi:hypothetical protein